MSAADMIFCMVVVVAAYASGALVTLILLDKHVGRFKAEQSKKLDILQSKTNMVINDYLRDRARRADENAHREARSLIAYANRRFH